MFEEYYRITPNANQSLTVEFYCLVTGYKSEYASALSFDNTYKYFEYSGIETFDIPGNAEAWQLFYNRFKASCKKGEDSFLTEDFDLERIKEEYSASEAICKKEGLEYDPIEDSRDLWDAVLCGEISEYDVDVCSDMWNDNSERWYY